MTGTTSRVQTLGGPALFVLLWSTGFVGAKYGLPYAEPFTFLSLRLGVAAALLGVLAVTLRSAGMASTPMAALSRAVVGSRGSTLIANLPGSPRGATESLAALLPVLRHALDQLAGGDH